MYKLENASDVRDIIEIDSALRNKLQREQKIKDMIAKIGMK